MVVFTSDYSLFHFPPTPLGPFFLTYMPPFILMTFLVLFCMTQWAWAGWSTWAWVGVWSTGSWASYRWLYNWLPLSWKPLTANNQRPPTLRLSSVYDGMVMGADILYRSREDNHSCYEFSSTTAMSRRPEDSFLILWLLCSFYTLFYNVPWATERVIYKCPWNFYFLICRFAAG